MQDLCSHAEQRTEHCRGFLRVLEALVEEVNPETAAAAGLSWRQQDNCRAAFEEEVLQQVFRTAVIVAMAASADNDTSTMTGVHMQCMRAAQTGLSKACQHGN
jgi:hypothetical protein